MEKIISIIIPVYNQSLYLKGCIDSIVHQLTDDIEVVLIDDGSNDGSEYLCDKFQSLNDNIITVHKSNGGLSSARNEGIKNAKGRYLVFLDSDDELAENAIEILKENINKFSPDMILYGYVYKKSNGYRLIGTGNVKKINQSNVLELLVTNKIGNQICFRAYKRELFKEIRFPEGRNYEDMATFYRLLLRSEKIIMIDSSLYIYNLMNSGSITQTISEKNLRDMYDAVNELINGLNVICGKLNLEELLEYYKRNVYIYIFLKFKQIGIENSELCNEIEKYLWSNNHYNLWKYRNYSIAKMTCFYLMTLKHRKGIKSK